MEEMIPTVWKPFGLDEEKEPQQVETLLYNMEEEAERVLVATNITADH